MLCDICHENLPQKESGAVKLLMPCNHRVHILCNKEGEDCQACIQENLWDKSFKICFLFLFGIACGYMLAAFIIPNTNPVASLSHNIRRDLSQIEGLANNWYFQFMLNERLVASLKRIHVVVKNELTQCSV